MNYLPLVMRYDGRTCFSLDSLNRMVCLLKNAHAKEAYLFAGADLRSDIENLIRCFSAEVGAPAGATFTDVDWLQYQGVQIHLVEVIADHPEIGPRQGAVCHAPAFRPRLALAGKSLLSMAAYFIEPTNH